MRTAKGIRVHVLLEVHESLEKHGLLEKHGRQADDSLALSHDFRKSLKTRSDIEMKENTRMTYCASEGKDYEFNMRYLFPSPHEEFDSGVVLDLNSACSQVDFLNQTDVSGSQCLTLIDNQETDSSALLDFLEDMSTFEPECLTDVTFVVENEDRKRELEGHCREIFTISRNDDDCLVNDDVTQSTEIFCNLSTDFNGNNAMLSSSFKENIERHVAVDSFRGMTSINLTSEGKILSSNLGEVINHYVNVTSTPSVSGMNGNSDVNDETIDVISSETICDKSDGCVDMTGRCDVMLKNKSDETTLKDKSDVMVTLKNKHDVMVTLKDKNDVMLTTLNGEFEPLLTQGVTNEDVMDVKLSVTDQIFSGFRKVAQLVMDSMVSVKTEDEDDQPYGEPS